MKKNRRWFFFLVRTPARADKCKRGEPAERLAKLFDGLLRFEAVEAAGYAGGGFFYGLNVCLSGQR